MKRKKLVRGLGTAELDIMTQIIFFYLKKIKCKDYFNTLAAMCSLYTTQAFCWTGRARLYGTRTSIYLYFNYLCVLGNTFYFKTNGKFGFRWLEYTIIMS